MPASFIGKLSQGYFFEETMQWGGGVAGNVAANKLEDITACDIEGCLSLMKEKRSF